LLARARDEFAALCERMGLDMNRQVSVRSLSPDEAIGALADNAFVIKRGKERVIEAVFENCRGQAFTDRPSAWSGALADVMTVDLSDVKSRAVFVASMNAVLRFVREAGGTVHCLDEDPANCGPETARRMESRFGRRRVGLIGLQPAILKGLAERFGADAVCVVDLNPENIGSVRAGVEVWDGDTDLPRLVEACEVSLATGSSIVNGTINEIIRLFDDAGKPLVFFGNTISGAAALLHLDRICPYGR
jgi:hypothetical protein